ncbi:type VI secretion system-associated protein TagO [Agrobacterium pusense]|uniref:type VI secretion system-associated protein TagO n=1 Tax=Agrobacterium pusense TaxID=648995 RepID=UPI002899D509|nr:type VI secretion system-associated protein TagO [Agrobacterium pusense]
MLKFFSAAAAFSALLVPLSSNADDATKLNECITVSSDLDRLSCYDKLSGRAPKTETQAPKGQWQVSTETSKMTDQKSVFLSVESEEVIDCGWNKGAKISMHLRCQEDSTDLFFVTDCHMTSGAYSSYGDIDYRVDTEKAKKVSGSASTDNKALGLWGGGKSIPVIKQMIGKEKIVVRMTPYSESPFTATFNIAGLAEAVKPLREECRW